MTCHNSIFPLACFRGQSIQACQEVCCLCLSNCPMSAASLQGRGRLSPGQVGTASEVLPALLKLAALLEELKGSSKRLGPPSCSYTWRPQSTATELCPQQAEQDMGWAEIGAGFEHGFEQTSEKVHFCSFDTLFFSDCLLCAHFI